MFPILSKDLCFSEKMLAFSEKKVYTVSIPCKRLVPKKASALPIPERSDLMALAVLFGNIYHFTVFLFLVILFLLLLLLILVGILQKRKFSAQEKKRQEALLQAKKDRLRSEKHENNPKN